MHSYPIKPVWVGIFGIFEETGIVCVGKDGIVSEGHCLTIRGFDPPPNVELQENCGDIFRVSPSSYAATVKKTVQKKMTPIAEILNVDFLFLRRPTQIEIVFSQMGWTY